MSTSPTAAAPVVAAAGKTSGTSWLISMVRLRNSGSTALTSVTTPTSPTIRATQDGVRSRCQTRRITPGTPAVRGRSPDRSPGRARVRAPRASTRLVSDTAQVWAVHLTAA